MADLLRLLLRVAEKAANVARVCRQEAPLFQLLVQEKTGDDKNKKFVQDFKTLADVVIQEMIRHDVGAEVRRGPGVKVGTGAEIIVLFCFVLFWLDRNCVFSSSLSLSLSTTPSLSQFPEMASFIHGEESNKFENGLGNCCHVFMPHARVQHLHSELHAVQLILASC